MKIPVLICGFILSGLLRAKSDPLPTSHFHHRHLNSVNPDAAIEFYIRQFPSTSKSTMAGLPALKSGNVYLLFNKVTTLWPKTQLFQILAFEIERNCPGC
jgi:hypothetical protein